MGERFIKLKVGYRLLERDRGSDIQGEKVSKTEHIIYALCVLQQPLPTPG